MLLMEIFDELAKFSTQYFFQGNGILSYDRNLQSSIA